MGLREDKKRLMRSRLSDTAARLFLARGFDAVRVAEVAEACGVSEKTVFNYFPTKEALLLDRLETTVTALRSALASSTPPVQAALALLDAELSDMVAGFTAAPDRAAAVAAHQRFGDLIRTTPSLRAYQNDMTDRLITAAAEVLATRAGLPADAPEPQILATALLGLWRVQYLSLRRHLAVCPPDRAADLVRADVHRAAALLTDGVDSLDPGKRLPPERLTR